MPVAWSGQTFALIDPRPGESCAYDPVLNRWRMECRPGDRRPEDKATVDRIGLDGWVQPMAPDKLHVTEFRYKPVSGCQATKPGDWQIIYETHAKDYPGSGPLKIASEWSDGKAASRLRIWRGVNLIYDAPDLAHGSTTTFVIHERFGELLRVWIGGKLVADYAGPYGYPGCEHYRCLRIYRNARDYVSKAEFRGLSVAS